MKLEFKPLSGMDYSVQVRGTVGSGESVKTQFSLSPGGSLNKTSIGGNGNTVNLYIEPTQEAGFITIISE